MEEGDLEDWKWRVDEILPPGPGAIDWDTLPDVERAIKDSEAMGGLDEVLVVNDKEIKGQALELSGQTGFAIFPSRSILSLLCIHIKGMEKYMQIDIEIVDDAKKYRTFSITNHRSVAVVEGDYAALPLQIGEGWQRLNIDLDALTQLSFRSAYLTTCAVRVCSSCRVSRIFFQDRSYSDVELPRHLRVLDESQAIPTSAGG
ncbi:unnamed protein product [Chrysoparadoxa australica]